MVHSLENQCKISTRHAFKVQQTQRYNQQQDVIDISELCGCFYLLDELGPHKSVALAHYKNPVGGVEC